MKLRFTRCALAAALVLLAACNKPPLPPEPLRPVLTQRVGERAEDGAPTYTGEVRSRFETPLGFRIGGKVVARLVDVGASVKAGDVLARLDPADSALSANSAQAQLDLASADLSRHRQLRAQNFVSQAALDAKETAYRSALAQADLARNQNAYAVLRADQAGVVAQVLAEAGQVVSAGQPVLRLARADEPEVAIAIPESRMREVRPGMPAEVTLWAEDGVRYAGVVRELATVADAATRTYAARIKIKAPDARLLLGMTASVRFAAEGRAGEQFSIPLGAVFQQDGKPAVWVVGEDQSLALRPVEILRLGEQEAMLAPGGLKAGERIVVAGVHKLRAGERIKAVDRQTAVAK